MSAPSATPDLASVLQALASYSHPNQQASQPPANNHSSLHQTAPYNAANDPRLNGAAVAYDTPHAHLQPQQRSTASATSLSSLSSSLQRAVYDPSSPPAVEPASITDWPLGLRCVTQMAARNAAFKPAVRKMIRDQKYHEQLWSKGLEDLLSKQGRPVLSTAEPAELVAINDDADVKAYAAKVYGASAEMHQVMSAELKGLGVPFFGTNAELVDRSLGRDAGKTSERPDGRIGEEELVLLQRKMVQYLEDMYG